LLAALRGTRSERAYGLPRIQGAWLTFDKNANEVATHLHVHPQTVRHRLRRLTDLFRDQIRDPHLRFELEIALRAYTQAADGALIRGQGTSVRVGRGAAG